MRPVAFDYIRPDTVEDASRALADDDDAAVLGGGQSLIPVLRFRLAAPSALVDLGGIGALREIREDGQDLVIGAMATHHDVARDPLVHAHAAVLAQAAASVADPQIRYRGTVGGALAHADPAGDIAPAALALDATLEITGTDGTRQVPAREFFEDFFTTALEPGELLSAIRVRKHTGWGMHYEKFSPRPNPGRSSPSPPPSAPRTGALPKPGWAWPIWAPHRCGPPPPNRRWRVQPHTAPKPARPPPGPERTPTPRAIWAAPRSTGATWRACWPGVRC